MKKYIYLLLLIPVFFSCEKDANVDIPLTKPQLVAACFVGANEDTARLKLSWSAPIFYSSQNNLEYESGAKVILSKGNQQYPMTWDQISESYIASNVDFKKGDLINLNITFETENIKSSCTIAPEPIYTMEYNGITKEIEDGWESLILNYKFTNNSANEINYYRILFEGYYTDKYSNKQYAYTLNNKNGEFYSLANGESTDLKIYFINYGENNKLDSIKYYVIRSDADYYKYHKSVYNYQGDDFFTEPSIIYNNVEGGLGIFCSYNMVTDTTMLNL